MSRKVSEPCELRNVLNNKKNKINKNRSYSLVLVMLLLVIIEMQVVKKNLIEQTI